MTDYIPGDQVEILVGQTATVSRVRDNGDLVVYFGGEDEDGSVYSPGEVRKLNTKPMRGELMPEPLTPQIVEVLAETGLQEAFVWWHHDDPLKVGDRVNVAHWHSAGSPKPGVVAQLGSASQCGLRHILGRIA